ncbi:bromo adjacent homology domain-containing 1 protein [Syngnathoides biaculeatus]|uniref:bromo adjacent homology domain-containing 1 protein n=1 Tax=Syngnathoides biaculeatus TaxID=300417 RepID=UPI002ADDF9FA|nr:bromo adjacent homology domain-containing 1 protein [Syngnathoides biaculeatus]XP_061698796.1 bromo adjacent homology domain-containing 1 protein [Syngnathoides biaculeatus]XP_061698797.1 bromo adjacent homology domain-containing 1 protein [Syngnathoides biaculeatus]
MVKAQRHQPAKGGKRGKEKGGGLRQSKDRTKEVRRKKQKKKELLSLAGKVGDTLDCCVLLTRLEEKGAVSKQKNVQRACKQSTVKDNKKPLSSQSRTKTHKSHKKLKKSACQQALELKSSQSDTSLMWPSLVPEPRRRRMASLNAEAVNSLLLYRANPLGSNLVKKEQSSAEALSKGESRPNKTKKFLPEGKTYPKECRKKQKRSTAKAPPVDWLALFAPTPRRQAGLTAATLLKLTGSLYGSKRQKKQESNPAGESKAKALTQVEISGKPLSGATLQTKRRTNPKHNEQLKHIKQGKEDPGSPAQGFCSLCKTEALDPEWKSGTQDCLKNPLHCGSMLGFSLKTIKEEEEETDVSSCYCCSQERCVEYCHRLALFLKDKAIKEPDNEGSLSEVFHHHHHHLHHHHVHHPAAITITPHAYACFPSYCVHFSHPDTPPSSMTPLPLCPKSGKRPKLLPSSGPQRSGISHPVYCCTSVEACYGEPCRINGYTTYSSVIPAIARGGCTKCTRDINRDDYSSTLKDHHSPSSIPVCPSPRILTGCPIPAVPPAGQLVPPVQTPLSDPSQPQPSLQVAKECPQSAKPPSGSRSGARSTGSVSSIGFPLKKEKKQKLGSAGARSQALAKQPKNGRQKSTNGWRPVGLPFEKEVFSLGEEVMVPRKCFQGVQRDGELIRVRDTVLLKSGPRKKSLPYVAKISALWEEPETGELMMSLFWYYRPEHTQGGRNLNVHCQNEIFASRHQDVNSVACIEDKCYVLTLAQYCRFCALVKRRGEGVPDSAASLLVPPVVGHAAPSHRCVPDDVDPELVFFCRHVYDFRYGRLLKNLQ